MEDLSDLEPKLIGALIVQLLVRGNKGFSPKAGLYRKIFVRLIDKANNEYQQAREYLIAEVEEKNRPIEEIKKGRIIYIFSFVNHLENCINAIRRLFHLIDRIKNDKDTPNIDRTLRRQIESLNPSIINIRDTIEHIDERIMEDDLEGQSIMLSVTDNKEGVQISNNELRFCDLASTLRNLHAIAKHLI